MPTQEGANFLRIRISHLNARRMPPDLTHSHTFSSVPSVGLSLKKFKSFSVTTTFELFELLRRVGEEGQGRDD